MLPSQLRKRPNGVTNHAGGPLAQAPARGDDDEWMTPGGLFMGFCGCLGFAALVATLVLASILMHRVVPPKALSATCDDSNPCTLDFLETVRGVDSGCCSHCNLPNEAECESACFTSPQCVDGGCTGTCKGHCEENNALDCPLISAVNLTALLGFGSANGNDGNDTSVGLYRECAFSSCIYTIDLIHINASHHSANGFVLSVSKIITGWGLNTTTNSSAHEEFWIAGEDSSELFKNSICLPLIAAEDRECLSTVYAIISAVDASTPLAFTMTCKYMFACSDPPSYGGSIVFPARLE